MKRFRISAIEWVATKKEIRKIPKVIWIETSDDVCDSESIGKLITSRFGFSSNGFTAEDVTIDISDFDISDCISGLTNED